MKDADLERNIKKLVIFFSLCFFAIIAYLTYFNLHVADKIVNDSSNRRLMAYDNEVLRGSIYDFQGNVIAYSKRNDKGQQVRTYNSAEAFAHVIGYTSYKYGRTGVELSYNDILQGKNLMYNVFGSMVGGIIDTIKGEEKKGNDIYLTLNKSVQERAYKAMGNDRGGVCAINPKTGEIIALVSTPSFNPGAIDTNFDKYKNDDEKPFINRAVQGYYPPGSVFKIVTLASALENNPDVKNSIFNCTGSLKIGNYSLGEQGGRAHGRVNIKDAFKLSCNYTFGTIGMELGYKKLQDTAEKFMFNKKISLNDEYEAFPIRSGGITIQDEKSKSLIAQDSIGQNGVTANPIQMALVTSAVANEGKIMKPYIIKEIKNKYGFSSGNEKPEVLSQAMSKENADIIKNFMVETVKTGTGKSVRISGITVGGKTGSAEDIKDKQSHSWFVALAPAENPQIVVAVVVENAGKGGGRGAEVAREVIKAYLGK